MLDEKDKKTDEPKHSVSFKHVLQLFRYANWLDILLIVTGTIFAIVNGASLPLIAIVFGEMTHHFISVTQYGFETSDNATEKMNRLDNQHLFTGYNFSNSSGITREEFSSKMATFSTDYIYISIFVLISVFSQTLCWEIACERQVLRLRKIFLSQILRQDITWYDENEEGDLTQKLSDDLERIREGIGVKLSMLTQYCSTFILGICVGYWANAKLTLALLALAPFTIGSSAIIARGLSTSSAREQLRYGIAGGIATEVITCIKTVMSFNNETKAVERYAVALDEGAKIAVKKYYFLATANGSMWLFTYSTFSFAFWYGAQLVESGETTPGKIFTVFFSVMMGAFSVGNALPFISIISTAVGAASTIFHIIDRIPLIDAYSSDGILPEKMSGKIEFKNVEFTYPSRPEIKVLDRLNLTIEEGKSIAIIGTSGAGKSTVIALLLRFYDVTAGELLIDGHKISKLNVNWLRKHIGVVSQEPILFGVSIEENIRYGQESVKETEIIEAAILANAHDFIKDLPEGYKTNVGDKGAMLSGGQKQRIALARALVRDPKILLLDEATSALDSVSEHLVKAALDRATKGRTTVIVAHRLSTVKDVDIIYALKDGKVGEFGNHSELMERKGIYYNLMMTQQINENETSEINSNISSNSNGVLLRNSMRKKKLQKTDSFAKTELKFNPESAQEIPAGMSYTYLLKLVLGQSWYFTITFLTCTLSGISFPFFSSLYADIFHTYSLTGEEFNIAVIFWTGIFICFAIVVGICSYFLGLYSCLLTEELIQEMRVTAFTKILGQPLHWFEKEEYSAARLVTRLARDPPSIKSAAGFRGAQVLIASVSFVAAATIALITGWKLALILSLIVPVIILAGLRQANVLKKYQHRDTKLMDDAGQVASEGLLNLKTVQALCVEKLFLKRYANYLKVPFKASIKHTYLYATIFGVSQALVYIMYSAAFKFGAMFIEEGEMDATSVYRVFFALTYCTTAIGHTASYFQDFAKAKNSLGYIYHLMTIDSTKQLFEINENKPEIHGKVIFEDIHFAYPSRPTQPILKGINLTIEPGQTVALVGNSGCGKSTLINLLEKFYLPDSGKILMDGHDINTINSQWLRSHMAIVSQEPVLFDYSIKENIAYGAKDPSNVQLHDIVHAATAANIHQFISNLPEGYDTLVGERGTKLSGGQKQRIAIARALIRNPRILLLDEATSALDMESEKVVQEALDCARKGRTSLVIAHRLSTIRNADVIVVISNGKIVEKGTHADLYNLKGFYYELVKHQQ